MSIKLFAHNDSAYRSACLMLEKYGKAAIIHPTGTGKSFIAFKLIEDCPECSFLWLSPSDYIFKTQVQAVKRESPDFSPDNVRFLTYAKLTYMSDDDFARIAFAKPDYIILDEYHRGGAPEWEKALRRLLGCCEGAKLLGLSATNVRYLDNQRDMARELFDGYIAGEITLGGAIAKKILPAPKYVMAMYRYDSEIERYRKRVGRMPAGLRGDAENILEALKRSLSNADGLAEIFSKHITKPDSRLIVFCSGREHMEEMIIEAKGWFEKLNRDMHIYRVFSENEDADREFEAFKGDFSSALKLLFCIDMLNEGIHVADVDGIIMLRPTVSPIVYKQQLGRALSAGSSKTPLIFDIVNNFDGLYSVGAIGEEMSGALRMYSNGEGEDIWKETGFTLIDEVRDARELFYRLDAALSSSWEMFFAAAGEYFEAHGNLNVPKKHITDRGLSLGMWITTQRRVYSGEIPGNLTPARIARLESIGMVWENRVEQSWNRYFAAAKEYFDEYGNLKVPARYVNGEGVRLGEWISNQRRAYKSGKLSEERVNRLNSIGMLWSFVDEVWESFYLEAVKYYNREGNLLVPGKYVTESGVRLGEWVARAARIYDGREPGASPLTQEQIRRLEEIGMVWGNRNDGLWMKYYEQARLFYLQKGNLKVPRDYVAPDGSKLGKWIIRQRTLRKSGKTELTPKRIGLLDEIGMDWRSEDPWEVRYRLAVEYKQRHGNLNIPAKYKTAEGIWLGNWIYQQKKLLASPGGELSEERRERIRGLING